MDLIKGGSQNDPDATITEMQDIVDCWEGVAKTTGGAIDPSKSWWYLVHFDWKDSNWTYRDLQNVLNDELSVKNK